jgi:methionyl aminopeptidase
MMFTIEPMVCIGRSDYKTLNDGWTVVTRDRSWSAQWEHTLGITSNGNVIFTKRG